MMSSQIALDLAVDSDFFDWTNGGDARFFVAPEVVPFNGYRIHAPQLEHGHARPGVGYEVELPRSAS